MKCNSVKISVLIFFIAFVSCCGEKESIALRKFPYPYIAALTITSDIDETDTVDEFLEIARFINTEDSTTMGKGAGLEIGYSFWFYDFSGRSEFTVFSDTTYELRECEEVIRDFIGSGLIDCIHTFGDFGGRRFRREFAEKALEYLDERDLKIEVWTNHGDISQTQQIGNLPHQRGDNTEAAEYHTDLLLSHGIRFIEKYEVTHVVGQDGKSSITDRMKQTYEVLAFRMHAGQWMTSSIFSNNLMRPHRLDDGQLVYSFKRFISKWGKIPGIGSRDLAEQIAEPVLDELKKKNGYMMVYTHLGDNSDCVDYLPIETRKALYNLAKEYRNGSIYVTTTKKLLIYNLVNRYLDWEASNVNSRVEIYIRGVKDEIGGFFVPSVEELQGITFYTPLPESTRIYIGSREIDEIIKDPPDGTGRRSVSIPLTSYVFPSKYGEDIR